MNLMLSTFPRNAVFLPQGFLFLDVENNCDELADKQLLVIKNVTEIQQTRYIVYNSFGKCNDIFLYLLKCRNIGIVKLSHIL